MFILMENVRKKHTLHHSYSGGSCKNITFMFHIFGFTLYIWTFNTKNNKWIYEIPLHNRHENQGKTSEIIKFQRKWFFVRIEITGQLRGGLTLNRVFWRVWKKLILLICELILWSKWSFFPTKKCDLGSRASVTKS